MECVYPEDDASPRARCINCKRPRLLPASFNASRTCLTLSPEEEAAQNREPGLGDELRNVIADIGGTPYEGCGCEDKVAMMNAWGFEKCLERRKEIVGWIKQAAKKRGWAAQFEARARAKQLGIKISLRSPYGSVFDEAVRRFRARNEQLA